MKKPSILLLLLCALLHNTALFANFTLRVGDPRFSWSTQQGTIEDAVLSIRPQGVYWEYGLYLTFSARGTTYKATDSLEVVLQFDLPENAIIHDSWLWVNDDIVKAKILDKWTASAIYEGIVQRRRDPSILTKTSATHYELRVFPMPGHETRKVKITFLMPAKFGSRLTTAKIPTQILSTSRNALDHLSLLVWPNEDWKTPSIYNFPDITFSHQTDALLGEYYESAIPYSLYNQNMQLAFNSPINDGYYFRTQGTDSAGLYQVVVFPDHFAPEPTRKKVALLFDYDSGGGGASISALLEYAKNHIKSNLSTADSFNLIFSNLNIQRVSNQWLPAKDSVIDAVFSGLNNPLSSYSNLPALLVNGIGFINETGSNGNILLLSNSAQYGENQAANNLKSDLIELMNPVVPFHIVDFRTTNSPYFYFGGTSYLGNEYLYYTLSQVTGGSYQKSRNTFTFETALSLGFNNILGSIQPYDFHTSLENGFCYGRFYVENEPAVAYLNQPLVQVGKYTGEFPFHIELSGEINGNFFSKQLEIPNPAPITGDTLMREMWFGKYIQLLESEPYSNNITFEIIANSITERVLSKFTAFLCLEDTSQICEECLDETGLIHTSDPGSTDSTFTAFPNPFRTDVTFTLKGIFNGSTAALEIYSIDSRLVCHFEAKISGNEITFDWDGSDDLGRSLPSGVYVAMAQINGQNRALKVIKQE